MAISDLVIKFGATGAAAPIVIAEQVYAGMVVGTDGTVTQDRWRANPVTVNGIVFTLFPGMDSSGRADCWIYAAYGEASAPNTPSAINRETATVDMQVTLNGAAQNLFGGGTTYTYAHQRSTWLRWQSAAMPWDTSQAYINARIAEGTFLQHDSHNVFASLESGVFPTVAAYQPFKAFSNYDINSAVGDQYRASTGGGERTAIGPVHEWFARVISDVSTNNNPAAFTALQKQILMDLGETAAQFPHASGFLEPVTNRLLDPSVKPHCSHDNANAWFGATGIPQPLFGTPGSVNGQYDNSHPFNKISFHAYHFSRDPFHILMVQGQAVCALTYQSLNQNGRGADGKTLRLSYEQERGLWWGLQMLIQAWHVTPSGAMPKPFRDKAWFATAINNTLQFIRDNWISATTHQFPGITGEAMRYWRVTSLVGNDPEVRGSHFQEDYGNIVLAQAMLLGYSAARDVAEWHAVNIQRRIELGGSWFLNDYELELTGFSGYALSPSSGALPYTDAASFKAWYPRKSTYTSGPVTVDFWKQQYGRDTYLFLGAVNVTKEAARRGLLTLGFDIGAAETELRSRFVGPPYIAASGNPTNYGIFAKQYFTYQGVALTAPSDIYSVASGLPIYGGRVASSLFTTAGDVGVAGDSITDIMYECGAYRLGLPLTMYPPRMTFNGGAAGDTVKRLADRFEGLLVTTDPNTSTPNLIADFPNINTWMIRIGTNSTNAPLSDNQAQFNRIFAALEAGKKFGIIHSLPPKGAGTPGVDSPIIALNAWLKSVCDSKPGKLYYLNDSQDMGDANYNAIADYYINEGDGRIHPNGKGIVAEALRMAPQLLQLFPHVDPRNLDASDTYATNPASNQYVPNLALTGSVPVNNSAFPGGVLPTGWDISNYNNTGTGCVPSVIAADANDPVQLPWIRLGQIKAGANGHEMQLHAAMTHPAIAADGTIVRFDTIAEVRFNALDTSVIGMLGMSCGAGVTHRINLSGNPGILTQRMVLRNSLPRAQKQYASLGEPLVAYPANSLRFTLQIGFTGTLAAVGSIDIRCVSVRGQTT